MKKDNYYDSKAILNLAKDKGVDKNALFIQTLKNYETLQLAIAKIDEILKSDEVLVSKEYVKGRENVYLHPAVKELSKLTDSSNKTLDKLLLIIDKNEASASDDLLDWVNSH